ncbi:MAG: hypothetical protein K0R65_241 [Crocinitomicaceae bacterium]|jgi:hypothetical protein|nr:hypothetical protein [Crocinitomicaceae bacterium]
MGIFNVFKSKRDISPKSDSQVKMMKFTDLNIDMFFDHPENIVEESNDNGFKKIVHLINLENPLYGLFNKAEVTFGIQDGEIITNESGERKIINVSFIEFKREISKVKEITHELMKIFGVTDDPWNEVDEMRIKQGVWRGRSAEIIKFDIGLNEDQGLYLNIFGFNDFLSKINN